MFLGTLSLTSELQASTQHALPSFKMLWKDASFIVILVPPDTTNERLEALIYEFRKARKENYLSKWFPPTTPGLKNKYSLVYLYVFSDPEWATKELMDKYDTLDRRLLKFKKEYVKHIRAVYYYELLSRGKEEGTLGDDNGVVRSPFYKILFSTSLK